jgi:hypothetical protein
MKPGDVVQVKTGFTDFDGAFGLVLRRAINDYFEVFVLDQGVRFYKNEHVDVISETR